MALDSIRNISFSLTRMISPGTPRAILMLGRAILILGGVSQWESVTTKMIPKMIPKMIGQVVVERPMVG